jgi:hypothetical protein
MSDRKLNPIARELIAAKKRIENSENWCRGAFELNGRMCALGALLMSKQNAIPVLRRSAKELFGLAAVQVNDYLGHAAVMQMYDLAISKALSQSPTSEKSHGE